MERNITVTGIGKASAKPDYVEISLTLQNTDKNYERATACAAEQTEELSSAATSSGFCKEDLKTLSFNVRADYDDVREQTGYRSVFKGYTCVHSLKIGFGFDAVRLSEFLSALSQCGCEPKISVAFTLKEPEKLKSVLLERACKDALDKAEIIAGASGVTLGKILSIDCGEQRFNAVSPARYTALQARGKAAAMDFTPDDAESVATAVISWEIF